MKTRITITSRFTLLAVIFFFSGLVGAGAQSVGPYKVGPTQVPFKFGTDAVVKLKLEGAVSATDTCDFTVTRVNTPEADFPNLCKEGWYKGSLPVKEPDPKLMDGQFSVYTIEVVGSCPDERFPFNVEIVNYGTPAPEPGAKGKAYKMRLIHRVTEDSTIKCRDITTTIDVNVDPTKDAGGGGSDGGKSEFFLVNLRDKLIEDDVRIDVRFTELEYHTNRIILPERGKVVEARSNFNNGVALSQAAGARGELIRACNRLKEYALNIQNAKADRKITAAEANLLLVRPKWIIFDVWQYMEFRGLTVPPDCKNQ